MIAFYLKNYFFNALLLVSLVSALPAESKEYHTQLLVVGGGASGTTAAIQASRMGVKTLVIEETEWLGGMLTSAGVAAIDGNHQMPSGLWGEFRQKLYDYYGGPKAVETGWVSNTLFEPSVGNRKLKELAQNPNLTIWYKAEWKNITRNGTKWTVETYVKGKRTLVTADLIIDATELGDVMGFLKIPYRIGMDSRFDTGESFAPEKANNIIQDLTYVVVLKDFGKNADKTIAKPAGYDPKVFECCCDVTDPSADASHKRSIDCNQMITYGKLPNNKYMINWPKCGNDIYLNIIELSKKDREAALKEAKLHSLRFIYHLQAKLGFKHLGIADDEFPTADRLPMIAYHREARRLDGKVTLTVNDITAPYQQKTSLYRTGIAIGDYPIDHHHLKNPEAPQIDFINIKVPAYNIPLGALVPKNADGIIVAEKSVSVTNIVAGASRLQPVVLTIGQAAGALAAVAIKNNQQPAQVNIRQVQMALLESKAYLMPFIDVKPEDKDFVVMQKIGATGILKGTGIPYKWANQTWFYPEQPVNEYTLIEGFKSFYPVMTDLFPSGKLVNAAFAAKLFSSVSKKDINLSAVSQVINERIARQNVGEETVLSRRILSVLIDHFLNPFAQEIDFNGSPKLK
ncbi:FAD-dependent oxidoreductase [Pedobacter nyackensis]|uniref:FAD dependent oxidoreductase n=1 Tax=Pedobacter nyackensis TaxID=475255 RepID=A0A1W2CL75_9SPHI|nr:FAD-dependent oxidoreductase [Pedobacter nyackensis]SMC85997.1 FAD dependent oxidoreductase [Pedobacter nyackensis]